MRRTIRITLIIIPALKVLAVPKVLLKYSVVIMALITDVEKAAKETKLLINCGG